MDRNRKSPTVLLALVICSLSIFLTLTTSSAKGDYYDSPEALLVGHTWLVSKASDGIQGHEQSGSPDMSSDGRYVAFGSFANNLINSDLNGYTDVFVHDLLTGQTEIVSISSNGTQGNDLSHMASISANGALVTYSSYATNLIENDTNDERDVFLSDRLSGQTERVSVSSEGLQGNDYSCCSIISANGRYVAFYSNATNLVDGDTNGATDVFVRDRESGITERVSVANDGTQGNAGSGLYSMSSDGRFIGITSYASNLIDGDTNGTFDNFVIDRSTDVIKRVSVASDGSQTNDTSGHPSVSDDGRFVAFYSAASNLVEDDNNEATDIFIHDLSTGETKLVSFSLSGVPGNGFSSVPSISSDGNFIVYHSYSNNMVVGDKNDDADIFLYDHRLGLTEIISISSHGVQANGYSHDPSISNDGSRIAFGSGATNLVNGDTNGTQDVFVHDRCPQGDCNNDTDFHSISGRVADSEGNPIPSVIVTTDSGVRALTDSSGFYILDGLSGDAYTLLPSMNGYIFSPESIQVTIPPDQNNIDFVATKNFRISHIEITQGIQTVPSSVVLVEGKPTVGRVYLESISGVVSGITGKLFVSMDFGDTWEIIEPINSPIYAVEPQNFNPESRYHSLEFMLDDSMLHGTITVSAEVNIPSTGMTEQSSQYLVPFNPVDSLSVAYIPLRVDDKLPDVERIKDAHKFLSNIFPGTSSTINYYRFPSLSVQNINSWLTPGGNLSHNITYLNLIYSFYETIGWPKEFGKPDQLFGWLSGDSWDWPLGMSDPEPIGQGNVAVGVDDQENFVYQTVLSHEIGHNLNLEHPECDDQEIDAVGYDFGYHSAFNPLLSINTIEFMASSSCDITYEDRWISADNFNKLFNEINNRNNSAAANKSEISSEQMINPMILVSGTIFTDDSASIDPVFQILANQTVNQNQGTDYCLKLENAVDVELVVDCFDLHFNDLETEEPLNESAFIRVMKHDTTATKLILYKGTQEIAEKTISAHTPTVNIISPDGGEVITGPINVTWNANDQDGDSLTSMLSYSTDNGQSWYHLAIGITENEIELDPALIPGSNEALLKITVSDGFNTSSDITDAVFTVPKHNPEALIISPDNNSVFKPGFSLWMQGQGYDLEDGVLSGDKLDWSSNVDGSLGTGEQIYVNLAPGRHTIELLATDWDGKKTSTSIQIYIGYRISIPAVLNKPK